MMVVIGMILVRCIVMDLMLFDVSGWVVWLDVGLVRMKAEG